MKSKQYYEFNNYVEWDSRVIECILIIHVQQLSHQIIKLPIKKHIESLIFLFIFSTNIESLISVILSLYFNAIKYLPKL